MKNTILKKKMPLAAATWTDAFRRVRNRIALVAAAICAAAAPLSSFAEATLTHRWSFTSDYTDSIGGTANGSAFGGTNPSFANGQVTFPGGGWGSGSADLGGPGLTGGGDTTIEIWAKNNALSAAEIMFEYGAPKNNYGGWGGSKQCFAYYWSDENAQGNDIFIVKKGNYTSHSSKSGIMPATVGTMYHFSFTFKADGNGGTVVNFARRNATTGALEASGTHTVPNWTLSHLESQTPSFSLNISKEPQYKPAANAYNGSNSRYSDSNATYDEVRIWNGVLSDDQLAANASMGPDVYASGLTEGFELAAGTKFNVPEEGYTASGEVTLGTGSKLRFDTANYHLANTVSFSATGYTVPSGDILDYYVELTDSANFTATLSGNTITVTRSVESSVATWTGGGNDGSPANAANWHVTQGETVLGNTVPDADTVVIMQGQNIDMQLPSGSTFACKEFKIGDCTFTANCDWRGLSQTPTIDGTANLNGHVLKLNDLSAETGSTFSGGDGSFVEFVVDESATIANLYEYTYIENIDNLAFSGSAKIRLLKKDGSGTLTVTRLQLGNKRNVDMVQANGTVNLGSSVNKIGDVSGKTSTYTMSGGSLTVAGNSEFVVGASGTGVFNQSGGSVTLNNWFSLGRYGGNGTYTITGGSLTANHTVNPMWIGGDSPGTGTFTIDPGATVTLKGGIDNGRYNGATGHIILNGGTMNVKGGSGFNIGRTGTGTFEQNGGTLTANEGGTSGNPDNVWRIGWEGKGTGSYTLNDGTATAKSPVYIGDSGTGTFTQNGGTMTAESGLTFAVGANSKATFTLSGGVLNTKSINKGSGTLNGVTFDGGTIGATNVTDGANFIKGLNNVTYGPGGLTLDTAGYDVTMATASGANVTAAAGSTFTKTGSGTLTVAAVPPVGNMVVSSGTLALSATCDNASMLAHRWSFNGEGNDYTDSITGNSASSFGDDATKRATTGGKLVLRGNGGGSASLNLGKGLLGLDDATVEIWASNDAAKHYARVFDYGNGSWASNPGQTDCFMFIWSTGTDATKDIVQLKKNNTAVINKSGTMSVMELGKQYYFAFTFKDNGNGSTTIKWVRRDAVTGELELHDEATVSDWTLATLFAKNPDFWLGVSKYSGDSDANASYDEVRIWNGALSDEAIALSATKGPDATADDIAEIVAASPAARTLTLESGATLSIGAGNTLTQPIVTGGGTVSGGTLVVSDKILVTCGETLTASGTINLSNAKIELVDPENLASPFTFLKPTAGQTLTVIGTPTPTNLTKRWKVSVSANGTGRIVKRGFVIIVK